jgi:AcrR family transcriptional regulator
VDTRDHLLAAAERLFAERGVASVSLREITSAAGANIAAVNYHFGSKENLVREVHIRRLGPLNEERLRLLTALEASGDGALTLEEILFAFVHPLNKMIAAAPAEGAHFARLIGRIHADSDAELTEMVLQDMKEMIDRFMAAAAKTMPALPADELHWRSFFATGVMVHAATSANLLSGMSEGRCCVADPDEVSRRMVAFMAGGFRSDPSRLRIPEAMTEVES